MVYFSQVVLSGYTYVKECEIQDIKAEKKSLSVVPKYSKEVVHLYDDSKPPWFGYPRYAVPRFTSTKMRDVRVKGKATDVTFTGKLWAEQEPLYADFCNRLQKGGTGFLVNLPPGSGKTVIALKMAEVLNTRTLIIVPRSNLVSQWKERFIEHTNLKSSDIGQVAGRTAVWRNKKIVIGLVHSVVLDRQGEDFKKNFGCVVFDEVDRSVPPRTFASVVNMFPAKYRIGLSATMERKDGLSEVFERSVGECMLVASKTSRLKPNVIIHQVKYSSGYVHPKSPKLNRRGMLLSRLAANPARNKLIARYAQLLSNSDRRCAIMSDRTQQLLDIRELLRSHCGFKFSEVGLFVRRVPLPKNGKEKQKYRELAQSERDRSASDCKIMLACVSEDTECLTLNGWKHYTDLQEGELIASYSIKSDRIGYYPLERIVSYPFEGELCHIRSLRADSLVTWDHRNVIVNKDSEVCVKRTYSLVTGDRLLLKAPVDYPINEGLPNEDWAELFGWIIAEGYYNKYEAISIQQKYGSHADRIQNLLNNLHLKHSKRYLIRGGVMDWLLTMESSTLFRRLSPDKMLNQFLVSLPVKQLAALFRGLILGDGCIRDGRIRFIQKSKKNLDWFSVIALRLGFSTVTSPKENGCSVVYLSKSRTAKIATSGTKLRDRGKLVSDTVWCPVVKDTGTWVARRNGKVFITGNTYQMMDLGTDIPSLSGLIYATPHSEIIQSKGRIERFLTGKKNPILVDIVDSFYPDCVGWGIARERQYRKEGLKISRIN